ncbi:hypothetical protein SEA_GRETCHEN_41 [Microbacterium phage Gretchen]|uniref:Uncharacterized protein n=1 Tax=Microbacterium phage Percival TaxID=2201439 RepID=A0A2Z4Q7F6_9CAUD|nr:hypothetical protein PBI_PERCIVAL_42 [Microbacterium phage Percival]UDL14815.1 hypothetical protein SEA_GRETCHEN_41 [Microbacterium phage Gretchen]
MTPTLPTLARRHQQLSAALTAAAIALFLLAALFHLLIYFGVPLAVSLAVLPLLGLHGLVTAALTAVVFIVWWLLLALLDRLRRK